MSSSCVGSPCASKATPSGNGRREMTLANCGAMGFHFAAMSDNPRENMAAVDIVPHSFGEAGGAVVSFTVPAGVEMTFVRLFRKDSHYTLGVLDEAASPREGGAVCRGCVGVAGAGGGFLTSVIRLDFRLLWPEFKFTLPKGYHDVRT